MKIKKLIFHFSGIIILLFLIQSGFYACPKCNQDFYNQLMGDRGNTLGGQELLEAIKNQSIPGQPSALVLPASYNLETDIKKPEIADNDNLDVSTGSSQVNYFTYIIIFVRLTFI